MKLLLSDSKGRVVEHPWLLATLRSGEELLPAQGSPISLPEQGKLVQLPGRRPVGVDPDTGEFVLVKHFELEGKRFVPNAVGALLPPGYTRTYLPGAADYSAPIRQLLLTGEPRPAAPADKANPGEKTGLAPGRRQDVDLIFLGTNSSNGRQLVPQLKFFGAGNLPTYSTSAIWEDGATDSDDLNGVLFPDSPWVVAPDARTTAVKNGLVRYWGPGTRSVSRLYALGYDAYHLLPEILRQSPGPFSGGEIPGATGSLYADSAGRIHRRLAWAEIRGGRPQPLPPAGP